MRHLAPVFLWALSAVALLLESGAVSAGGARTSVASCVKYRQKADAAGDGADIHLDNRCRTSVACSVEWSVVCDDEEGPRALASFELARGARHVVDASVADCDGDWEVKDVLWTCHPAD